MKICYILSTFVLLYFSVHADLKSPDSIIKIDLNSDGKIEAEFNSNGLAVGGTSATANLDLRGSMAFSSATISSNTTLGDHTFVLVDTSSDNITVNLPYAGNVNGHYFTIKKISPQNTLSVSSDNLIDDQSTLSLTTSEKGLPFVSLLSNGQQWYVVNLNASSLQAADDGLSMYWSFNDGDGVTTPHDSSRNSYTGSFVKLSSNAYEPGVIGDALRFGSGAAEYVDFGNVESALDAYSEITVSVWVKSDIIGTDKGVLFAAAPDGSDNELGLRYDNSGSSGGGDDVIKMSISTDASVQSYESANFVQTTSWQHLLLTWRSGESLKLYINGVLDVPTYTSGNISGTLGQMSDFRIGQGTKDSSGSWDGLIDEVRIYNRVLNSSEIQQLYQEGL